MGGKLVDWNKWRKKFVKGSDKVTLTSIAQQKGSPALQTLRNKSADENWDEQRKRYRRELENRGVNLNGEVKPEVAEVVDRTNQIIDRAQMLTEHNAIAKGLLRLAARGINELSEAEKVSLKSSEISQFAKLAIDIQRTIEGMATSKTEVDLKKMSDADLDAIINGNA